MDFILKFQSISGRRFGEVLAVHRRAVQVEKGYTVFKRAGEKHLPFSDALAMLENTSTSGRRSMCELYLIMAQ